MTTNPRRTLNAIWQHFLNSLVNWLIQSPRQLQYFMLSFHLLYSRLMTSLLISFKLKLKNWRECSHPSTTTVHLPPVTWNGVSEVKPSPVCWNPYSPMQELCSQNCLLMFSLSRFVFFFLTLLSFQSAHEYAVIFSSSYPFESRRTSGILQYYLC